MKSAIGYVVVVILAIFLARTLWPRTVTKVVAGPPLRPDTVRVHEIKVDTLVKEKVRERVVHDTVNKVIREFVADTLRTACASFGPKTYVTQFLAGTSLGDTSWISGEHVQGDSAGIVQQRFTEQVYTEGYLMALSTSGGKIQTSWKPFSTVSHGDSFLKNVWQGIVGYGILRAVELAITGGK